MYISVIIMAIQFLCNQSYHCIFFLVFNMVEIPADSQKEKPMK